MDYGVRTVFTAKNNLSPEMNRMGRDVERFGRKAKAEFRTLGSVFKGSFAGTLAANAMSSGLGMVRRGIEGVATDFIALDKGLNEAAVKFGGIDYGSEKFKELSAVARQIGTTTKFSAIDAAGGLEALAAAGFAADNALKILPTVANFAAAAKMDLASATQIAGEALNSFGMNAKDAATQTANLARISDVMAESDRMSNASMAGLAETVSYGASAFTNAGQSLETFGAVAASLADSAKHGSMAGTIMRGMMDSLTSRTPAAEKAIRKLGLSIKGDIVDKSGNLNNVVDILKKMEGPLKGMGTAERAKAITDIFDIRAGAGVMSMINSGIDKTAEYRKRLEETSGTAERSGKQLTTSLGARIDLLQNAFTEKGFQVFDQLLTGGTGKIDDMISAVQRFDVKPIASGIKTIADAIGTIASHTGALKALGATFLAYKAAVMVGGGVSFLRQFAGTMGSFTASGRSIVPTIGNIGALQSFGGRNQPSALSYANPATMTAAQLSAIQSGTTVVGQKAKFAGVGFANAAVGVLQAAGIGVTIGMAASEALNGWANSMFAEMDRRNQDLQKLRGEAGGLDVGTVGGAIRATQIKSELDRQARGRAEELTSFGGIGKNVFTSFFGEGDSSGTQALKDIAILKSTNRILTDNLRGVENKTKIEIELTGDGADKARIVSTKTTGESAPKVSKNRTGKQ